MTLTLFLPLALAAALLLGGLATAIYKIVRGGLTRLQVAGIAASLLALISIVLLPAVEYFGVLKLSGIELVKQLISNRVEDLDFWAILFVLALAPIVTFCIYANLRRRSWWPALVLLIPSALLLVKLQLGFDSKIGDFNLSFTLGIGGYLYVLCGLAMLFLPRLVKEKSAATAEAETTAAEQLAETHVPQNTKAPKPRNKRLLYGVIGGLAIILLLAAAFLLNRSTGSGAKSNPYADDTIAIDEVEAVGEFTDETTMPADVGNADWLNGKPFVEGLDRAVRYDAIDWGNPSAGIQPFTYHYSPDVTIWAGEDHGSFVLKLNKGGKTTFLNISDFNEVIDVEGSVELLFGQVDIDGDGSDELIFAGRTI